MRLSDRLQWEPHRASRNKVASVAPAPFERLMLPDGWREVADSTGGGGGGVIYEHAASGRRERVHPFFREQWIEDLLWETDGFQEAFSDLNERQFATVNDLHLGRAYRLALEEAVAAVGADRARVLDIGGNGVLAMAAAQAGAAEITACEANAATAEITARVLRRNGFLEGAEPGTACGAGQRQRACVHLIRGPSADVTVAADAACDGSDAQCEASSDPAKAMLRRANILVAETVSTHLLSDGVLGAVRDAWARLLAPGAVVIPHRARLVAAVVESDELHRTKFVGDAIADQTGFDLRDLNLLRRTDYPFVANLAQLNDGFTFLTDKVTVLDVDFGRLREDPAWARPVAHRVRHWRLPARAAGVAHFVCAWFELQLDPRGRHVVSTDPDLLSHGRNQERGRNWGQGCTSVNYRTPAGQARWTNATEFLLTMMLQETDPWPTPLFDLRIAT